MFLKCLDFKWALDDDKGNINAKIKQTCIENELSNTDWYITHIKWYKK